MNVYRGLRRMLNRDAEAVAEWNEFRRRLRGRPQTRQVWKTRSSLELLETRCVLNAAPIALSDVYATPVDVQIERSAPGWLANDSDSDGDVLQIAGASQATHGNVTWAADGQWSYQPASGFVGVDRFQYQATDGQSSSALTDVRVRAGTYAQAILADRPLAYWPLDHVTEAIDLSGNEYHGVYHGVTSGAAGAIAAESTTAAQFATGNAHIHLGAPPALGQLRNNITLEAWVRPTELTSHHRIFSNSQHEIDKGFGFGIYQKSLVFTTFGILDYVSKPVIQDTDRWYHVAVVFDADNDASFYVNGELIDKVLGAQPPRTLFSAALLGTKSGSDEQFRGTMDEVAIYDRALTGAQIAGHFEMGVLHAGKIPEATADFYQVTQDGTLHVDQASIATPRYSFDETFEGTSIGPNFYDSTGSFYPANGRLHTMQDRQYLLTTKDDYVRGDFRFEVDLDLNTPHELIQFIGIGSGERESAYNEPTHAVVIRFHSAASGGDLGLTSAGPFGGLVFGKITEPGYHRVRMSKVMDRLTVEVDAHFDGIFRADYSHDIISLSQYAPFLDQSSSHLLVGGSPWATFDNLRVQSSIDPLLVGGVLSNDRDADGDQTMAARLVDGPKHGSLQLNRDGTFAYRPQLGFHGDDGFSYRADDGTNQSNLATAVLRVMSPLPIAREDRYSTNEDTELRISDVRAGVLQNDRDPWELPLSVQLEAGALHGVVVLASDGTFVYTPSANYVGPDSFGYSVSNGTSRSEMTQVLIDVQPINDRPVAGGDEFTLDDNGSIEVSAGGGLLANDEDAENDTLRAVLQRAPSHGTLTLNPDGSFRYSAGATFVLTDQFSYIARDASIGSLPATVVLKRNSPTIVAPTATLLANTPDQRLEIRVSGGQAISGLDLFLQVGDGGPELTNLGLPAGSPGPRITQVELKSGTLFEHLLDQPVDLGSLPQLANWSIANVSGAELIADGLLATITIDTTGFFGGEWDLRLTNLLPTHPLGPLQTSFAGKPTFAIDGHIQIVPAEVKGRFVFYNNSRWDGLTPEAHPLDDEAIATDKQPLFPGQAASFANYTSYSQGINGVMVDVARLPHPAALTVGDFVFRTGRNADLATWQVAPTPTLHLRPGEGLDGSDRLTFIWPDGAIRQQWLEITLPAGARTHLAADDRFYFGNAIGETGNQSSNTLVTSIDVIETRDHQRGPFSLASVFDPYDFNRDRLVSSVDVIIARDNQVGPLLALPLFTPPVISPKAARATYALLGDSNLDGVFDSQDLLLVFQAGKFEDSASGKATWSEGDWNGDGEFSSRDLVLAFARGNYRSGVAAIPAALDIAQGLTVPRTARGLRIR